MNDMKVTFPKLKSHSEHQQTKFTCKAKTLNTIPTDHIRDHSSTLHQKIDNIKYKYINKSPTYFKHRNLSQAIKYADYSNETIEHYVASQKKMFDKQMLLELARSRVRKLQAQQQHLYKRGEESGTSKTPTLDQTKYENFRPMRMPTKHAIKHIKHPNLTLPLPN